MKALNKKRTAAGILALLMLASSMTACTNTETPPSDTTVHETNAPATDSVETEAPTPSYDTNLVTENGIAKAHIVVPNGTAEGADQLLTYAAEELAYHINKVSGAAVTTVSSPLADSLPIIIATPDSLPELETLFPDDLQWLRTLTDEGSDIRYGDDGFAIRTHGGKIYIFGATSKGALNGTYDFMEENMGLLWISTYEDVGTIYKEQPTITVTKTDYREKSPLTLRGYCLWGASDLHLNAEILYARNKLNLSQIPSDYNPSWCPDYLERQVALGITGVMVSHDVQEWILQSPLYDPECTEYWNELEDGVPVPVNGDMYVKQVNYWSDLTADTLAASVIAYLDANPVITNVSISVEDNDDCRNYPECTLPFEYAEGQFVNPQDEDYLSTLFFTFLNKVAAQVAEMHPDVIINTLVYWPVECPPRCELAENLRYVFAPITKDEASSLTDLTNHNNAIHFKRLEKWKNVSKEFLFYDYYFAFNAMPDYERPIWYDMQTDLIYYAENGFLGPMPQGLHEDDSVFNGWGGGGGFNGTNRYVGPERTYHGVWIMNALTMWIYHKLCWNPYEDIDALIVEFCDKVYGAASEEMQEYYALLYKGWTEGESERILWNFKIALEFYLETFVYMVDIENDIKDCLSRAYDAADTDAARERIGYIKTVYELNFPEE